MIKFGSGCTKGTALSSRTANARFSAKHHMNFSPV